MRPQGRGRGVDAIAAVGDRAGRDPVTVPGAVTAAGEGPPPTFVHSLDELTPARDLLRHRRKYFIGTLDPCASIEFSRGCPWDCSFCSAWTFYGRSYRLVSTERVIEDLRSIREPGIFIVDDVAFIHERHGLEIGEAIARAGIKKRYYLETRGDVLLRNKEAFRLWARLGLLTMFLGLEAIDEAGLKKYRKRVALDKNFEAVEFARSLGVNVAVNLIADPDWDHERFRIVREWCLEMPDVINISVNTPYPGTESWVTESRRLETRDYRLFDIQHAVLPTRLPLAEFYEELVTTQRAIFKKHLDWHQLVDAGDIVARLLLRGQTNFVRSLFQMNKVYRPELLLADHGIPVAYEIPLPPSAPERRVNPASLYVHAPRGRRGTGRSTPPPSNSSTKPAWGRPLNCGGSWRTRHRSGALFFSTYECLLFRCRSGREKRLIMRSEACFRSVPAQLIWHSRPCLEGQAKGRRHRAATTAGSRHGRGSAPSSPGRR